MKLLPVVTVAVLSFLLPASVFAIEYGRELEALIQEHDRAVATAVEPVHRRFRDQLEALQRRATQSNDLETALRIKKMLEELGDPSGGAAKGDIIGNWLFENKAIGAKVPVKFLADGTYVYNQAKGGTWDIKGKQLEITYTINPGIVDHYDLPIKAGKLTGANSSNQVLNLTKRGP